MFIAKHPFEGIPGMDLVQLLPEVAIAGVAYAFQHRRLRAEPTKSLRDDVFTSGELCPVVFVTVDAKHRNRVSLDHRTISP